MGRKFILQVLVSAVALAITDHLMDGFSIAGWPPLLVAAFFLGVIHTFVEPVLKFLTFPVNLLTLGIWNLVLNLITFLFVLHLISGITAHNLLYWLGAWLLYSLLSFVFSFILRRF